MAKNIYGDWKSSGFNPHEKYPIPEFKPLEKSDYNVNVSSIAETPYMMLQWMGPDYRNDSAATVAADVFSAILSLNSSKWQQALVDKGLATYAGVNYSTCKYVGPIQAFIVPNPLKLKECYEEAVKEIKAWGSDNYFSDEQLKTAKESLIRNKIRNEEKPSELAHTLTYWWCSTSLDFSTDYDDNMQKITRADIQRYLKKYITDKPLVAGLIINDDMNKKYKPSEYFTAKSF
jgi:zinc protease